MLPRAVPRSSDGSGRNDGHGGLRLRFLFRPGSRSKVGHHLLTTRPIRPAFWKPRGRRGAAIRNTSRSSSMSLATWWVSTPRASADAPSDISFEILDRAHDTKQCIPIGSNFWNRTDKRFECRCFGERRVEAIAHSLRGQHAHLNQQVTGFGDVALCVTRRFSKGARSSWSTGLWIL